MTARLDREKARTLVAHWVLTVADEQVTKGQIRDVTETTLDALEACIVPDPGVVTLTRDEAQAAADALRESAYSRRYLAEVRPLVAQEKAEAEALAERLERGAGA